MELAESPRRSPSIEKAVVSVVVSIAVISAVSVFVVGFDQLISGLQRFGPVTLGTCFLLLIWHLACRFSRWFCFLRCLGLKIVPAEAALFYSAGMAMTLTPGRVGEAWRLWFLEKRLAVPYRRIAGLYVADRVSDALAYLILLAVGASAYAHGLPIAWSALVLIFVVILTLMKPRFLIGLLSATYARVKRGRQMLMWMRRAIRNTSALFQPRIFVPGVLLGAAGWLAAPAVLAVSLAALGIDLDPLRVIFIYAAAALAGGATMMPGGGGATEVVLVSLLTAADVPLDSAFPAMVITRMTFLLLPIGFGILAFPSAMKRACTPPARISKVAGP